MPTFVLTPDPDNDRQMRVVDQDTGRVVAGGHLVVDWPEVTIAGEMIASVRFVGESTV